MSDSEEKKEASAIPSWQRSPETDAPVVAATESQDDKLEVARRFLDDEAVKDAPREKKIEFLKEKGIEAGDIQKLLGEEEGASAPTEVRIVLDESHAPHPNASLACRERRRTTVTILVLTILRYHKRINRTNAVHTLYNTLHASHHRLSHD